jgi:hypothetical protein
MLAPDNSGISFASNTDLTLDWIVALRVTIDRDWTWDGLAPTGISVIREGAGEVGRIELRRTINSDALIHRNVTAPISSSSIQSTPSPRPASFRPR